MRVLDKKVLRDLRRLWAQALAIALVMACGVATIVIAVGAYRSLEETRSAFYERYRFGTVFASATKAPLLLKAQLNEISGVSGVSLRIVQPVLLDVEGMAEPATGMALSIPDRGVPTVNQLYVRKGRLPEPGRTNEVALIETFAKAHGFTAGDSFRAIMNGRKRTLTIVGIVLSPEYIYAIGPGDMVPDPRRFGIFYMSSTALSALYGKEGAFDSVSLTVLRSALTQPIIDRVDLILKPYGGTGAYGREDQMSHAFLDAELDQLEGMAKVIPPIFLFVAAFLVNMVLSRLIALEREQIGLFKALGYGNLAIGLHYAKLVVVISCVGLAIGSAAGFWLGQGLTNLYARFFSFPFLIFRDSPDLYFIAGGLTVFAALAGAGKSIWTIVSLPPAVAMRPAAPDNYRGFLSTGLQRLNLFSQLTTMALRHLIRWPVRSFLTTLGAALSVALLVTALFSWDSIDFMVDTIFFRADRQDATLSFNTAKGSAALHSLAILPGVIRAEPYRSIPVKLRNRHHELRMPLIGIAPNADLSRVLDLELNVVPLPQDGLILSERVAEKLRLRPGDKVEVELLERENRTVILSVAALANAQPGISDTAPAQGFAAQLPIVAVSQSYVGLSAFMSLEGVNRLMRDGKKISGARILIDRDRLQDLYDTVKKTPAIASIALQKISRDRFRETINENISIMNRVYVSLAVIITFGVIYNSARIQLSERARELASLRVFGFTRAEVSRVLITELSIMVVVAQPLGWLLGFGFSWAVLKSFQSDLFRVPLVIEPSTFATASLVVLATSAVSALIVRRRIDRLDLIRVLKTRE